MDPRHIETIREAYGGPMTAAEVELLRDMQGFIDFAIRNGLGFAPAIAALGHDVNNLFRFGLDLDEAVASGFTPKVSGYSRVGADSVGAPDETPESP